MTDQNKPEGAISEVETPESAVDTPNELEAASGSTTVPPKAPVASGGDEIPYIDDPVSKWWIGIIIAVFALIFAYAILFGRGGLLADIFTSDSSPSPESSLVASPSALPAGSLPPSRRS